MGLFVAAIVGPITILCIQKTLARGFKAGLLVGLGCSLANVVCNMVVDLKLTHVTNSLIMYEKATGLIGGIFLFWIGIMTLKLYPLKIVNKLQPAVETSFNSIISSFFFALSSPFTLFLFIIYSGHEHHNIESTATVLISLLGIFLGSIIWWLGISSIFEKIRSRLSKKNIVLINKASGISLLVFGCYAFSRAF